MAINFQLLTLRGEHVTPGVQAAAMYPEITGSPQYVSFAPRWGSTRGAAEALAVASGPLGASCQVVVTGFMPVLVPSAGCPTRELVLIQEYSCGCGAKRWPDFNVTHDLTVLAKAGTGGGSGGETWSLVNAPLGWAAEVAAQFDNRRDAPDQTIDLII